MLINSNTQEVLFQQMDTVGLRLTYVVRLHWAKKLFTLDLSIELKNRIVKSVLWSVVLYASETRTMTQADRKRLKVMKMWIWRRMEKIHWVDKMSNEKVVQKVNKIKTMLETVRKRKRVVRACAKT